MIIPDANLLIYAYDAASPFHARAKRWWEELLSGPETVGLCPCVLFAFIRISTHARAFENPLSIEDAVSIVEEWLTADKLDRSNSPLKIATKPCNFSLPQAQAET